MERKHTPGPWMAAAKPSSVVGWPVVAPHDMGRSICNVTTGHEHSEVNARLIAAAPDLLEALREMLSLFDHCGLYGLMLSAKKHGWAQSDVEARMAASAAGHAAIARATGQPTKSEGE